jgi:hypothetical protein
MKNRPTHWIVACLLALAPVLATNAQTPEKPVPPAPKPEFPPHTQILSGFEKVVSTSDGAKSFYTLWHRKKDGQLYAELPRDFAKQRHFMALTVASGEEYAGLQAGDGVFYWRQYDKRLALVEPNFEVKSSGDPQSKSSVNRLFTDKVLLDVPIVTMIPKGGPLIDLDALLVGQAGKFFGRQVAGLNPKLHRVVTAKAFPQNVEVGIEVPVAGGQLRTLHYSISLLPPADPKVYQPRVADERVGYFTTSYVDFGKFTENETRVRYINRWNLKKADPSLKLSPPKEPIVFYIEHTTPIRYRRWVRQGILMWNKAFEKVGIIGAIEVRQQDAASKSYMDLDPEDVRYNFVRWLSNGAGTAIGPSRVHPETGQILDADIVLTDGWIRHWWTQYNELLPKIAAEGMAPETMSWLAENPDWDPRILLAPPRERARIRADLAANPSGAAHPLMEDGSDHDRLLGEHVLDGLRNRQSQRNGLCLAANCKTHGIATMRMMLDIRAADAGEATDDGQIIDGIPEKFIGPLLADLTVHEVGHTLGLRHNFKGSSIYSLDEINSEKVIGKKPFASSVMDYIPVNMILAGEGEKQGDYGMISVGPYDEWAIEYGYSLENDLKPILARVADPLLQYATDEDTGGSDPLARRYDFSADPLDYSREMMEIVRKHRGEILDKFVKDGQSWSRARRGYLLTLSSQSRVISMMANWLGGAHVYRHRKGDPNGKAPIEVVPADQQRRALQFVIENSFRDDAYGLTPELLRHMTVDKWWDNNTASSDPAWPVHDRVHGLQASALTYILNPTTLGRVYDNEFRVPADQDALTLPEVLDTVDKEVWSSLAQFKEGEKYTARQPLISSFQRNLQREYLSRLTGLANGKTTASPAQKPISDLASAKLALIKLKLEEVLKKPGLDSYSSAHLLASTRRIEKALEARYVIEE